jgi:colanic acid/amylovoran biosynthesis glycosyltransferase
MHPDIQRYQLLQKSHVFPAADGAFGLISRLHPRLLIQMVQDPKRTLSVLSRSVAGIKRSKLVAAAACLSDRGPFDILHCHFGPNGLFGALLKRLGVAGRLVTTFHGYDMTSFIEKHGMDVYQILFETGDLFLPISEKWQQRLQSLGGPANRIVVHRMGVDPSKFEFVTRQVGEQKVRLVSVARLVEKKGIDIGIRAVAKLKAQHPEVAIEYLIAGDGPLMPYLKGLIQDLACEDTIRLLGWRDQDEVEQLMASAHILMAPSVTGSDGDQEGIPVVLMEALAKGVIVCASAHGCIPELIVSEQTGFLVPEGDMDTLSRTLDRIITKQDEWPGICERGHQKIRCEYNINKLNKNLIGIFDRILNAA